MPLVYRTRVFWRLITANIRPQESPGKMSLKGCKQADRCHRDVVLVGVKAK